MGILGLKGLIASMFFHSLLRLSMETKPVLLTAFSLTAKGSRGIF